MNADTFYKTFVVGNSQVIKFRFIGGKDVHLRPKKMASKSFRDENRTQHFLSACPTGTLTKRHLAVHDFFHVNITEKRADFSWRSRREKGRARVLFSEIRHARVAVSRPPRFLPAAPPLAKKTKSK